jgi:hypothetical protein
MPQVPRLGSVQRMTSAKSSRAAARASGAGWSCSYQAASSRPSTRYRPGTTVVADHCARFLIRSGWPYCDDHDVVVSWATDRTAAIGDRGLDGALRVAL